MFTGDVDAGPTYKAVGQFQRTKAAGIVKVVNLKRDTDLYALYPFPPAEVRDLRVSNMSYDDKTVTLQWTAVGDYVDQETGEDGECSTLCVDIISCNIQTQ